MPNPSPPEAHQGVLAWVVNNWQAVEPRLLEHSASVDVKNTALLFDLRIKRGGHLAHVQPEPVMAATRKLDLTAIRQELMSHPYLYNRAWCKQVAVATKEAVKKQGGKAGCCCLIAYGDDGDHSSDGDDPKPDFCMNVATYFVNDLKLIAQHNMRSLDVQRAVAARKAELLKKTAAAALGAAGADAVALARAQEQMRVAQAAAASVAAASSEAGPIISWDMVGGPVPPAPGSQDAPRELPAPPPALPLAPPPGTAPST